MEREVDDPEGLESGGGDVDHGEVHDGRRILELDERPLGFLRAVPASLDEGCAVERPRRLEDRTNRRARRAVEQGRRHPVAAGDVLEQRSDVPSLARRRQIELIRGDRIEALEERCMGGDDGGGGRHRPNLPEMRPSSPERRVDVDPPLILQRWPVTLAIVADRRRFSRFDLATAMRELASPVVLDPDLEPTGPTAPRAPSLPHALLVFVGGFLGTLARYAVVFHHAAPVDRYDPAILLINASGALVLGILGTTLFVRRPSWTGLRVALATGFLGGWTTYSAIIAGSLTLTHEGAHAAALVNLGLELVVPVLAAGLGLLVGSLVNRWRA